MTQHSDTVGGETRTSNSSIPCLTNALPTEPLHFMIKKGGNSNLFLLSLNQYKMYVSLYVVGTQKK